MIRTVARRPRVPQAAAARPPARIKESADLAAPPIADLAAPAMSRYPYLTADGIQAGFCAALTFSYPLMMHPAMQILERAAAPHIFVLRKGGKGLAGEGAAAGAKAAADGAGLGRGDEDEGAGAGAGAGACGALSNRVRSNLFRAGVVAATLVIAFAGSTQLDNFVSLIGCFCCTPLAFIYPCWFHLKLVKPAPGSFAHVSDWLIIAFGVGVFFFSTYEAIVGWTVTTINPCI